MTDQEQHDTGGELAADHAAAYPRPLDEVELLAIIRQLVRTKGGGDVQRAFGRPQMAAEGGPAEIKVSGGVRLPSLGGGNRD